MLWISLLVGVPAVSRRAFRFAARFPMARQAAARGRLRAGAAGPGCSLSLAARGALYGFWPVGPDALPVSPVARGAQGSCRGGDLRWRPRNRNRRLGKRRRGMPQSLPEERERGRPNQRHQAVCRPCIAVDAFAREAADRFIATARQTVEGEQRPGRLDAIEPLPDLGSCKKSSATMAQLAMPNCRETGGFGRSHSLSFDHRFRPDTLRTAMATAFFCPTSTTSFLPRVTPV